MALVVGGLNHQGTVAEPRDFVTPALACEARRTRLAKSAPVTTSTTPATPAKHPPVDIAQLRHTAAHVLAYAVQDLFPEAKPTIGPAIDNGFYYDFDRTTPFTPEDLAKLEARMREIVQADYPMTGRRVTRDQACAANAAACSWRWSTARIPSEMQAASVSSMGPPIR